MSIPRHPIRGLAPLFALLVVTAGCELAPSFHLPAQREQLITDPSAIGLWFAEQEDALAFYRVSSPTEDTAWHEVEIFGGECEEPAVLEVAFAAIGDDERILILTSEVEGIAIPVYWSGRLWIEGDRAHVSFLDGSWLSEHLLDEPSALAHVRSVFRLRRSDHRLGRRDASLPTTSSELRGALVQVRADQDRPHTGPRAGPGMGLRLASTR
jgi:hypothetical protein